MTRHNFLILCNVNIICLSHNSPNLCSVIYLHKHVRLDCSMFLSTLFFSFRIVCAFQFLFLQSTLLMGRIHWNLSVVYPKKNCLFRCPFLQNFLVRRMYAAWQGKCTWGLLNNENERQTRQNKKYKNLLSSSIFDFLTKLK